MPLNWTSKIQKSPRRGEVTLWKATTDSKDITALTAAIAEWWQKLFSLLLEAGDDATIPPGWDTVYCLMHFDSGTIVAYPARSTERKNIYRYDVALYCRFIEETWYGLPVAEKGEAVFSREHTKMADQLRCAITEAAASNGPAEILARLRILHRFQILLVEHDDFKTASPLQ
jgi:hypothetical protein